MFSYFQFRKDTKCKPGSFRWFVSGEKVLFDDEVRVLRRCSLKFLRRGITLRKFHLVRNWFMVELGLFAGLRVEEMTDLQVRDIVVYGRHSSIEVRCGKGCKAREVLIGDRMKRSCKRYLKLLSKFGLPVRSEDFLVCDSRGNKVTTRALQKQFKKCIFEAGLPDHYSMHSLRHTYATGLLKSSGNLKLVQRQLGHASIKTTAVYISLLNRDAQEAVNSIYQRPKEDILLQALKEVIFSKDKGALREEFLKSIRELTKEAVYV